MMTMIPAEVRQRVIDIVEKKFIDKADLDFLVSNNLDVKKIGKDLVMPDFIKYELKGLRNFNIKKEQGVLILSTPLYIKAL